MLTQKNIQMQQQNSCNLIQNHIPASQSTLFRCFNQTDLNLFFLSELMSMTLIVMIIMPFFCTEKNDVNLDLFVKHLFSSSWQWYWMMRKVNMKMLEMRGKQKSWKMITMKGMMKRGWKWWNWIDAEWAWVDFANSVACSSRLFSCKWYYYVLQ